MKGQALILKRSNNLLRGKDSELDCLSEGRLKADTEHCTLLVHEGVCMHATKLSESKLPEAGEGVTHTLTRDADATH